MPTPSSCVAGRTRGRLAVDPPAIASPGLRAKTLRKAVAFRPRKRHRSEGGGGGDHDDGAKEILVESESEVEAREAGENLPAVPATRTSGKSVAERTRSRYRNASTAIASGVPLIICIDESDEEEMAAASGIVVPKEEVRSMPSDSVSAVRCGERSADASGEDKVDDRAAGVDRVERREGADANVDDAGENGGELKVEVEGQAEAEGDVVSGPPIGSELGSNLGSSGTLVGEAAAAAPDMPEGGDGERVEEGDLAGRSAGVSTPEVDVNCIARRTRSKLWFGKELEPVDYSVFFRESDSSDAADYLWRSTPSPGSWSSEDTFGDGSSFWSETESEVELELEGNDGVQRAASSGEVGSIGTPFARRSWHSSLSSSRGKRKNDFSRSPHKSWRNRRKHSGGDSSSRRKKHRFSDYDDENDSDYKCEGDAEGEECGSSGAARRQRQRNDTIDLVLKKKYSKENRRRRRRRKQQGTAARPHCIDVEEQPEQASLSSSSSSSSSGSDGLLGGNVSKRKDDLLDDTELRERMGERQRKKRKRQKLKDEFLFNPYLDDILKKDVLDGTDVSKGEQLLPLVFSFGDDEPELPEKTEYEKAMEELWDDYNFALRSVDIGCYNAVKEEQKLSKAPEHDLYSSIPCTQDQHEFILDEEIGFICKHCCLVALERRYVLPKFGATSGIYGKGLSEEKENMSILDALCSKEKNDDFSWLSGMHSGTVWDLIPNVKDTLYPHQQEGFEFMWKNLAGDIFLEKLKNPSNPDGIGGCVISHAPGTGKSRLAIVFLQSFMAAFPYCRPVILAPRGMLLMWDKEFKKWKVNIPFHLLNGEEYSGKEDASALSLARNKPKSMRWMRVVKLLSWNNGNGVLGVSYGLFEKLVGKKFKRHAEAEQISNILIERPGLFIFDEGHTPRNERSNIWKVLEKVKAERRVILSGTPFQNNFGELYNTLCLVRPKFAEKLSSKRTTYRQKYAELSSCKYIFNVDKDEGKGKWAQLTSAITDESLKELKLMMNPFVHVHNGSILKKLPGLKECLVILKPLPIQKEIIRKIESLGLDTTFGLEYKISLALIHPSLYISQSEDGSILDKKHLEGLRLNPDEGAKTRFVVELVRLSSALREKVLVFSQYIEPLSLMKDQLISMFHWSEGKEILQMDGTIRLKNRQTSIDIFNNPASDARVLLASTRACCEGISLTGASRVVLLDVVWNPSVENQAISRAYRLGQEKLVYTYNLISSGTREIEKYSRQVQKERISEKVFSSRNEHVTVQDMTRDSFEDKILDEMKGHEKLKGMFKQIIYQPKNSNLLDAFDLRWRE